MNQSSEVAGMNQKRLITNNSKTGTLFSQHFVGDNLDKDDEVYLFEEILSSLPLDELCKKYSSRGGKVYNPKDIFSTLAYSFFTGITSSRAIARSIKRSIPLYYLSGGNKISHETLSNFKRVHKEEIKKLFTATVEKAIESGLVQYSQVFGLDGTKFKASASMSQTSTKEELSHRREDILTEVEDWLDKCEQSDKEDDAKFGDKNEHQQNAHTLIRQKLAELKKGDLKSSSEGTTAPPKQASTNAHEDDQKSERKKKKKKLKEVNDSDGAYKYLSQCDKIEELLETHKDSCDDAKINMIDPDSKMMKSDQNIKQRYNAQAISNQQIIVAADVSTEENDQNQLIPMVEQMENNLNRQDMPVSTSEDERESQQSGENKLQLTADAGYNKGANLEYLDSKENIEGFISMRNRKEEKESNQNPCHKNHFTYDEDEDHYVCPQGKSLEFQRDEVNGNKKTSRYAASVSQCMLCPFKSVCLTSAEDKKRGYRSITSDEYHIYRQEMKARMSDKESKQIYRKRSGEIESVFGQIKYNRGIDRFYVRGLEKVKAEFNLICLAHNLGKLMRNQRKINLNGGENVQTAS